jgi:diguanylate cyclase (GGDEF)-like protein
VKISLLNSSTQKSCFESDKELVYVGRGAENDLSIDDPSVSRVHARILKENRVYYIEDMKSRNGTWVRGEAIASGSKVEVTEGCLIALGDVMICLGDMISPDGNFKEYTTHASLPLGKGRSGWPSTRLSSRKKLEILYQATATLLESVDLREICERVIQCVFMNFRYVDAAVVLMKDEEKGELKEIAFRARRRSDRNSLGYSRTVVARVMKEGKAVMVSDTLKDGSSAGSDSVELQQIRSILCVPLIGKKRTLGAFYIHSASRPESFQKEDLFFVTSLAGPAALALDNSLLYSQARSAEESLKESHCDLERQVLARTAELVELNKRLQELSITDGLTGIYNHRHFVHLLEIEYDRALRYRRNLSLLMIDIDEFKQVNDGFGHRCGDSVLQYFANILKGSVRRSDIIARYGGDEFGILLPETKKSMAIRVSEKIRTEVEKHPFTWEGKTFRITVSIGIAGALQQGVGDWNGLLNAADQALYRAKGCGRNRVVASNLGSPPVHDTLPFSGA